MVKNCEKVVEFVSVIQVFIVTVSVGAVTDDEAGWQWREGQSDAGCAADVAHHRAAAAECSGCQPGADVNAFAAARSETGGAPSAQCSHVAHTQSKQVGHH